MILVPLTRREVVAHLKHHRHLPTVTGYRFAIGCRVAAELVGVAVVGRPKAKALQDGRTVEVTRCCTLSTAPKGTCSWLYARCRRAAAALGFQRIITYTLVAEGGASLRGVGWTPVNLRKRRAETWDRDGRPRAPGALDGQQKIRWEAATA